MPENYRVKLEKADMETLDLIKDQMNNKWSSGFRLLNHAGNRVVVLNIDSKLDEEENKIHIANN